MKRKDYCPIEVQHPIEAKKTSDTADGLAHQGIPEFELEAYFMPSTPIFLSATQMRRSLIHQARLDDGSHELRQGIAPIFDPFEVKVAGTPRRFR